MTEEWKNAQIDVTKDMPSEFAADISMENKGTLEYRCQIYTPEEMYQWCLEEKGEKRH